MPLQNRINREARGFLDLFRAKVGGQGPQTLLDTVQPTVDVNGYLSSNVLRGATSETTGNPPANISIAVPELQSWLIYAISIQLSSFNLTAINTGAFFGLQIQGLPDSAGATTDINLGGVGMNARGAGASVALGESFTYTPPGVLILPSGTNIQGQYFVDNTSINYRLNVSVLYAELNV